ncbi:lipoate--protein ligase family protein [Lentzea sp. PSKA42]|uniref:Lipoate--protein ligase family protein n=1 Tax=Lentzea indica TaxID=2604800 RepID=A0ABX1FWR8_9PSEU|nr:lipoate--protein ligase family protein [Lentzea indica]NKE63360.1 lipoate--protein ligase family protein [Lentzea indica]
MSEVVVDNRGVPTAKNHTRLLVSGSSGSAVTELMIPALLLRGPNAGWSQLVHIYVPHGPVVAFSGRDLRSPGIAAATEVARSAGFEAVVRSPGGRMVAYDSGAVVIDHLDSTSGIRHAGRSTFAENAESHARVLRGLGDIDARVGEVDGEYCPGEFSVNVEGRTKVVGSAQRVTSTGSLFSTVVQVTVSDRVRAVITAVSEALGYDLRTSTIAGLADYAPALTAEDVAAAFASDYRGRLGLTDRRLPTEVVAHASTVTPDLHSATPFHVDDWTRANPIS